MLCVSVMFAHMRAAVYRVCTLGTCVLVCVWRLEAGAGILLNHSLPHLLGHGFSLNLELINWARLTEA